jgi:hypothetical protein
LRRARCASTIGGMAAVRDLPLEWVFLAFAGALVLVALRCGGGGAGPVGLPASWSLTPGVTNPDVTQQTIGTTICVHGWTRTIRPPTDYTSQLKLEQMREYGFTGSPADYQEDHLISLELGGHPTDPRNLWPEKRPRADEVDALENDLNRLICDGSMSLADAQRKISEVKHMKG